MRIAVISPFVDRQHGTERAVAELVDHLAADEGDSMGFEKKAHTFEWLEDPEQLPCHLLVRPKWKLVSGTTSSRIPENPDS